MRLLLHFQMGLVCNCYQLRSQSNLPNTDKQTTEVQGENSNGASQMTFFFFFFRCVSPYFILSDMYVVSTGSALGAPKVLLLPFPQCQQSARLAAVPAINTRQRDLPPHHVSAVPTGIYGLPARAAGTQETLHYAGHSCSA